MSNVTFYLIEYIIIQLYYNFRIAMVVYVCNFGAKLFKPIYFFKGKNYTVLLLIYDLCTEINIKSYVVPY